LRKTHSKSCGVPDGYLDTNVVLHAQTTDDLSQECQAFLDAIERGDIQARLEVTVLHELTYALPRYLKQLSRAETGRYLSSLIEWPGIVADKNLLIDIVDRWARTPGLSFVDAQLAALAAVEQCPVYTKNVREVRGQGADVPDPLPTTAAPSTASWPRT